MLLSAGWTGPDIGTLVIAVVAVVLSAGSLLWHVLTWVFGGARVKVAANSGVTVHPLMEQQWFIQVEATNAGRSPTVVSQFGFEAPSGHVLITPESYLGHVSMPQTIEPGASASFAFNPEALAEQCVQLGVSPESLVPYAKTGHGRKKGTWKKAGLDIVRRRVEAARMEADG